VENSVEKVNKLTFFTSISFNLAELSTIYQLSSSNSGKANRRGNYFAAETESGQVAVYNGSVKKIWISQ